MSSGSTDHAVDEIQRMGSSEPVAADLVTCLDSIVLVLHLLDIAIDRLGGLFHVLLDRLRGIVDIPGCIRGFGAGDITIRGEGDDENDDGLLDEIEHRVNLL